MCDQIPLPWSLFMHGRFTAEGSAGYDPEDFREVIEELSQGRFPGIEKTITQRISIEDAVTKGFDALAEEMDKHVKILISPKPSAFPKEIPDKNSGEDRK
jgi:threonine dehydrogenase-like Zn-dependent dehydrogenase